MSIVGYRASNHPQQVSKRGVVLTFRDEQGREWLAAAAMGPLKQYDDDVEVTVEEMKDRAFTLHRFTVVDRSGGGDD